MGKRIMTQSYANTNQLGVVAAVWFVASPFAVTSGTAGYPTLNRFDSTGNSFYEARELRSEIETFSERLLAIQSNYGLEKKQLARLLAVGRPTLDSWIGKKVEGIRPRNKKRLELLEQLLGVNIPTDLRAGFGQLLKRKLDEEGSILFSILSQERIDEEEAKLAFKAAIRRLSGLKKAEKLDRLLGEDRPTFI